MSKLPEEKAFGWAARDASGILSPFKFSTSMGKHHHVLAVPLPAQGHVMPLMRFSHKLVDSGVKVTFVNAEHTPQHIEATMAKNSEDNHNLLRLVSLPDGMENEDKQDVSTIIIDIMPGVMTTRIQDLIVKEKITFVIADLCMGWVLEIAENMGINRAAFCPASVSNLMTTLQIPKFIEDGIIDENGLLTKSEMIKQSPTMDEMNGDNLWWINANDDLILQRLWFGIAKATLLGVKKSSLILCNSIYELESSSCNTISGILPIGPLLATDRDGQSTGNFFEEDLTCLSWLDQQPINSVIYVAFGSTTIFNRQQFDEIALGLELLDRPYLWVVRSDLINGDCSTVPRNGKIVNWAPQYKVLAHPSIACFISHCGWNSTMEGLTSGVPFLCLPYFADQFTDQKYICDVWKVGLRLDKDENGIVSRNEIKMKVEKLICDEGIKENALEVKEMAARSITKDGSSWKNWEYFLELLQK